MDRDTTEAISKLFHTTTMSDRAIAASLNQEGISISTRGVKEARLANGWRRRNNALSSKNNSGKLRGRRSQIPYQKAQLVTTAASIYRRPFGLITVIELATTIYGKSSAYRILQRQSSDDQVKVSVSVALSLLPLAQII